MYDRGMKYLASTQSEEGDWRNSGGDSGPGVTGLCLMVFLASGEDPNFGVYANHVRKAVRSIIEAQNAETGLPRSQHVPSRLRHARAGRGVWRRR